MASIFTWMDGQIQEEIYIKGYICHEEDASTNTSLEALRKIEEINFFVSHYDRFDVFNMNEIYLFYKIELNFSIS